MANSKIEWLKNKDGTSGKVWNPTTGCSKVSTGCANCYAENIAHRFWGERKFTDVQCHLDRLEEPLHWRKPQRVFVNSMSDLFHEDVPDNFIYSIFTSMGIAKRHTFMILTKRLQRMEQFFKEWVSKDRPLPNLWLGATVENQEMADLRIPILLQIPAAIRFVSVEPMLGPISFERLNKDYLTGWWGNYKEQGYSEKLDWVICGGESGPNARPMHPDWARSIRDQCQTADVPFFFKSWGEWYGCKNDIDYNGSLLNPNKVHWIFPNGEHFPVGSGIFPLKNAVIVGRFGKKAAGDFLDGKQYHEFPEVKK